MTNEPAPIALFSAEMLQDPDAAYRALRERDPVSWDETFAAWVLTGYAEVEAALLDGRLSSTFAASPHAGSADVLQGLYAFVDNSLVFSDPPRHTRMRELVGRAFTPEAVAGMRPRIQQTVDDLLDAIASSGHIELVRDFAYPLPITVITGMLGLAAGDRDRLKQWCDDFLLPFGRDLASLSPDERERAVAAGADLGAYVRSIVAQPRRQPAGDLLGVMEQVSAAGERLTEDELFANVVLFLIAGHENLTDLLSGAVVALLQNPEQVQPLKAGAALPPHALEELVRYVTPNQFIRRRATVALQLGGKTIEQGQSLLLVLAAANRDPAVFPDPDRLDLGRNPNRHLAFGHGFHYCLGAPLARLEAEIALETLLHRFPGLELATERLEYQPDFNQRALAALPLRF